MDKMDRIINGCAVGGFAAVLGCAVGNVWPAAGFFILLGGLGVIIWASLKK